MIVGGFLVPYAAKIFKQRTSALIAGAVVSTAALVLIAIAGNFWLVLGLLAIWSLMFSAIGPVRQAYVNGIVPSAQRATVLSADNMMTSAGGVIAQPALGKVAEVWGYPASYLGSCLFPNAVFAVPCFGETRKGEIRPDP